MMNDARYLRAETILARFSQTGAKVAVVTAKDKLRTLLGSGMRGHLLFGREGRPGKRRRARRDRRAARSSGCRCRRCTAPSCPEFVFAAGVKLMARDRPAIMYLSTTDYVQHKHAPGTLAANAFYAMMSTYLAQLDALGATIALTAGSWHEREDGRRWQAADHLPAGLVRPRARCRRRARDPADHRSLRRASRLARLVRNLLPAGGCRRCRHLRTARDGAGHRDSAYRAAAAARFELPPDRLGDIVITSNVFACSARHRRGTIFSGLDAPLRSHGGISEQRVPLLFNRVLHDVEPGRRLRNFDVFDLAPEPY